MGSADYYAPGQWNFYCDLCGKKEKSSKGRKTWDGFYVCISHKEERNPQDFVRGVKDNQTVPWSRPEPPLDFVLTCTLRGSNAIPGYAIPGCPTPSHLNLLFIAEALPEGPFTPSTVVLAIPGYAAPNYAVPGNVNRGGNDLSHVFDSLPTKVIQVQSKLPGHETETFMRVIP